MQGISLIVRTTQISLAAISFTTAPTADGYFTKVSNDAWYAEDFVIAHQNGLDIPADFDPNAVLSKEQFVHYLVQVIELTGQYPLVKLFIPIEDEQDINVTCQGTIQRALLYKIVSLNEEGNFDPAHVLTRAEAAAILYDARAFIEAHQDNTIMEPEA
ncbi:S-layer homology domain-containing protein [Paenibacillus alkaliterrae]|uniref:S-layer homology domain-containing protein n=1 Tax=Paenibacillus alkaliterrae TaxID=320909 RepID=UPI001F1F9A26|nr:S-layer homology domain-containing protein [Paenibacillus alkaliterrae]MCF2940997.1 S-layer homology domain-containing protein [Paenibacillus alkaliterrae]